MEPQFADTKERSKDGKSRDIMSFFLNVSVHRKQTPFVVVGSLKIYEKLHELGWYGRRLCGDFLTVFLYEVGACADPGIFAGGGSRPDCKKTALTTFLVLNFTEGVQ